MTAAARLAHAPVRRVAKLGPLWLAAPGVVFLAVFLLVPVLRLFALSVEDADTGALTLASYARLFGVDLYLRVLGITFRIAGLTAVVSVVLGYPLAYWLAKQPAGRRGRSLMLVLVPFWTSYLVKTFAWVIVLGRTGVINAGLQATGLIERPLNLYHNEVGTLIGMVHSMLPLAVLAMLPVMTGIDERLTPVAATLGAAPAQRFWLVYVPLSMSGVAAAGLLSFISSLGFFIVPALLGGRQQTMLAQLIITEVQEVVDWGFAGSLSALLLAATLATCWVYDRIFGLSSLSGDPARRGAAAGVLRRAGLAFLHGMAGLSTSAGVALGRVLPSTSASLLPAFAALMIAFLVLPILVVIPMAFSSSSFLQFPPPGYGLRWFEAYFGSDVWTGATLRSFGVAAATAILATVLGGGAALGLAQTRSRWRGATFALFLAPMIVPRIVLAVGLFYLFAQFGLVASDLGLVLGHTLLAIPFATVAVTAVLKTYDWRLDQVAATLGANRWRSVRLVTLPLIRGGLAAAALFAFITSFDELTVALFVSGGIKTTLPKQMWDDMILQLNPTLAAASVVTLAVITGLLLLAERLRRVT